MEQQIHVLYLKPQGVWAVRWQGDHLALEDTFRDAVFHGRNFAQLHRVDLVYHYKTSGRVSRIESWRTS